MGVDQQLKSQFDTLTIPVLPAGVPDLIRALSDERMTFQEIAAQVERFPSIVARLISLSNSAWSAPAEPITTLENAIGRLGIKVVRSVSIALAVSAPLNTLRCPSFKSVHYWADVLLVADIAAIVAEHARDMPPIDTATARVAGLIHNLGLLLLVDRLPQQMDEAFSSYQDADREQPLSDIIASSAGLSPAQAGAVIAQRWEMPTALGIVMTHFDEDDYRDQHWELVTTVSAAIHLTAALNRQHETMPDAGGALVELFEWQQLASRWDEMIRVSDRVNLLAQQVFG